MKMRIVMILGMCMVHNAYASSLGYGAYLGSSMYEAEMTYAFSSSIKDTLKQHPYLFGGIAVLGTAAIMYKVRQSRKESIFHHSLVSPEVMSSPLVSPEVTSLLSDSEQTDLTPGILELMACGQKWLSEEQEEIDILEEKAKKIEMIRIVKQVIKNKESFRAEGYKASLIKHKETKKISVLLKGVDTEGYRYELFVLGNDEAALLCRGLSEYLDPFKRSIGEQKLRNLIDLKNEEPFSDGALKALLNGIRSTIEPLELEV